MKCLIAALCCFSSVLCLSNPRVVALPPDIYEVQKYLSGTNPNPSVYSWNIVKNRLEEKGVDLCITSLNKKSKGLRDSNTRFFVFHNINSEGKEALEKIPLKKRVLWIWEPAVVRPDLYKKKLHDKFFRIYTWDDTLVDGKKYHKFYYPHCLPMREDIEPFSKRKFCCLINSNKKAAPRDKWLDYYAARRRTIRFFENLGTRELDLYGRGWAGIQCDRGHCKDKFETMKNYKFCICYENTNTPGYITEKIFDCFRAGVVPVYLGAENVSKYIPPNCYIDRKKFRTHDELYVFMKSVDEERFEKYLEDIRAYLSSKQARVYTPEHFVNMFVNSAMQ